MWCETTRLYLSQRSVTMRTTHASMYRAPALSNHDGGARWRKVSDCFECFRFMELHVAELRLIALDWEEEMMPKRISSGGGGGWQRPPVVTR